MDKIEKAFEHIENSGKEFEKRAPIPFKDFLKLLSENPYTVMRNVFQVFYDMIKNYVGEGIDEYPDDPESINYIYYDCSKIFAEGSDNPFFADRLIANRLINMTEAMKRGTQQNKIYIFVGPPGSGKSTFLNNLLLKFEEYANTELGLRYEMVWRIDKKALGISHELKSFSLFERMVQMVSNADRNGSPPVDWEAMNYSSDVVEIPCPCHDNPILIIPKSVRRAMFDDLFKNDEFKWKLFTEKEYEWVFKENPCTICSSLYEVLLERIKNPSKVFEMVFARPYIFNRRVGEGISVFSAGDKRSKNSILSNSMLQKRINSLLEDSNQVNYIYSRYAKTNNGIYALMDIKNYNNDRLMELHNIISEGIHKVEDIEERVNSLFFVLMNPEDKSNIDGMQSFTDRIEYVSIPYVLDWNTEVEIYRNIFGKHIDNSFLPRVLNNFARVVVSTRLNKRSDAMLEWIEDPKKYELFCDKNLQLLKMEIYFGNIPTWLSEYDRKRFTAKRRRKIIAESEFEGHVGFSGRDSIKIFNEFHTTYAKEGKLITMSMLCNFFTKLRKDLFDTIPEGFLESLLKMYNYTVLQEVKESLYYYNEERIARDIQNYIFAVNFEVDTVETCKYTGEKLEITEAFLQSIENRILGSGTNFNQRKHFRHDTQREFTTKTLTHEIMIDGKKLFETTLYDTLREKYVFNLKARVLDPFLENENFRRAIKDYDTEDFKAYDKRIRDDVTMMIHNLCEKYKYMEQGAKEVCIYVIDNDLARLFGSL